MANSRVQVERRIKKYFLKGYSNRTVLVYLGLIEGISISLPLLKRILKRLGLRRRACIRFSYLRRVETLICVSL